jgi:hypothetical protein
LAVLTDAQCLAATRKASMLFNSYEFIFAFLPVTLLGFYVLGSKRRDLALRWLTVASLFFTYGGDRLMSC